VFIKDDLKGMITMRGELSKRKNPGLEKGKR